MIRLTLSDRGKLQLYRLKKNDSIYVYSDGVNELVTSNNKMLGQEEFLNAISDFNDKTLDELLINLRDKQHDQVFVDDCSIVKIIM